MAALLATVKTVDVAAVVDGVAVNVPLDKTRKAAPKGQPQTARPSKQRRQVRAAAKIKAKAVATAIRARRLCHVRVPALVSMQILQPGPAPTRLRYIQTMQTHRRHR